MATTIRPCCGTPIDSHYPSPHARDCVYTLAPMDRRGLRWPSLPPTGSGGPYCLRPGCELIGTDPRYPHVHRYDDPRHV